MVGAGKGIDMNDIIDKTLNTIRSAQFHTDSTGREFSDKLSDFLIWYLYGNECKQLFVPFKDSMHFVEGVTGITIFRHNEFQVQMFVVEPNVVINSHTHPNVDSYEVFLKGMTFTLNEEEVVNFKDVEPDDKGLSNVINSTIRVLPDNLHGGTASPDGGCFLSVQRWLNGVEPTSVGNDWIGKTMGKDHDQQVITKEEQINEQS